MVFTVDTSEAVPDVAYNGAILHGVLTRLDIPGDFTRIRIPLGAPAAVLHSGQPLPQL